MKVSNCSLPGNLGPALEASTCFNGWQGDAIVIMKPWLPETIRNLSWLGMVLGIGFIAPKWWNGDGANGCGIWVNPTFVISRCRWKLLKPLLSSSRSSTMLSSEVATPPGKAASMEAKPASVKLDPAFNQLISSHFLQMAGWNSSHLFENGEKHRASCSLWAITWNMRPFSGATLAKIPWTPWTPWIPWILCLPVIFPIRRQPITLTRERDQNPTKIGFENWYVGRSSTGFPWEGQTWTSAVGADWLLAALPFTTLHVESGTARINEPWSGQMFNWHPNISKISVSHFWWRRPFRDFKLASPFF